MSEHQRMAEERQQLSSVRPPHTDDPNFAVSGMTNTSNDPPALQPRPPTPFPSPALIPIPTLDPSFNWNQNFVNMRDGGYPAQSIVAHCIMPWMGLFHPYHRVTSQEVNNAGLDRAVVAVEREGNNKKYKCEFCARQFCTYRAFEAHYNSHIGRKFYCTELGCPYICFHPLYLKQHMRHYCRAKQIKEERENHSNILASTSFTASSSDQSGFISASVEENEPLAEIEQLVNSVLKTEEEEYQQQEEVGEKQIEEDLVVE